MASAADAGDDPDPSGVLAAAAQTGDTSAVVTYRAEGDALSGRPRRHCPSPT
ncbi:hypothetical protein ACFQ51_18450 [Streptomyces kaempferi]